MESSIKRNYFPFAGWEKLCFQRTASSQFNSRLFRYAFSFLAILVCFLLQAQIVPLLANRQPFVIFTCAVALATVLGGVGPGLFALVLASLGGLILSREEILPLRVLPSSTGDLANLFAFVFPALMIWAAILWLRKVAEARHDDAVALGQAKHRLEILYSVTEMFAGANTLEDAAPDILKRFCAATGSEVASLWTVTPGTDKLLCLACVPCSESSAHQFRPFIESTRSTPLLCGLGLPGRAWEAAKPICSADLLQDAWFIRAQAAREAGLRSGFALPILYQSEVIGVVEMFSREIFQPNHELLDLLGDICARIGIFAARSAAFQEKSQRLSASLIVGRAGTFRWNVKTNEVDADLPLLNVFGLSSQSAPLPVSSFRDVVHPEDLELFDATLLKTKAEGVDFNLEYRILRPDKSTRWISARSSVIHNATGVGDFAIGACFDITERRKLELQLQDQRDILAKVIEGADLPHILESLTSTVEIRSEFKSIATIHLLDSSRKYLYPAAVGSAPPEWIALISKVSIGPEVGSCGSAAYSKQTVLVENTQTDPRFATVRREAEKFNLAASWSFPILSAENQTLGTLAVYSPVPRLPTDQELHYLEILAKTAAIAIERRSSEAKLAADHMQLEEQVLERTGLLRTALAEREAFCYSLSHDLRAPLRAMQGYAGAVIDDFSSSLPPKGLEYLQKINRASVRMDRLIQDVLAVATLSEIKAACPSVDLNIFVPDVIAQYSAELSEKIALKGPLPKVLAHEGLLTQALCKILDNALKFASPARPLAIEISSVQVGEKVRILIRDNGIGIDEKYQHRLFKLFGRIHPDSHFDGSGIGLVIAKTAVEKMHGSIGFLTAQTEGCTFWLELPASSA
jgi:signal transduction histidine kinase/PAS domain-containing protein